MKLDNLQALSAVIMAGSLVMERLVTTAKTVAPRWFAESPVPNAPAAARPLAEDSDDGADDPGGWDKAKAKTREFLVTGPPGATRPRQVRSEYTTDRNRRLRVLLLVFGASFTTAWVIAESSPCGAGSADRCRQVLYGSELAIPWYIFGVLISGGSAFWTNIVGFVSAAKDVRGVQKTVVQQQLVSNARLE
jgi:hypothetical protein